MERHYGQLAYTTEVVYLGPVLEEGVVQLQIFIIYSLYAYVCSIYCPV